MRNERTKHLKRATGRTTRMLKAAIREALTTRSYVYVVEGRANSLRSLALSLSLLHQPALVTAIRGDQIAFLPPYSGCLVFLPADSPELDFLNLTVHGYHGRVFYDHSAIESRLGDILEELHRYDEEVDG